MHSSDTRKWMLRAGSQIAADAAGVILAGWWIALEHLPSGIALCITIIGIPFVIANFKLIPVALMALGK